MSSVGTLARGLDVLELFAHDTAELTQTEISERLGLPVPTVHRLTKLLLERGYLARDPRSRRLRLGLATARLVSGVRLPDAARRHLRALADETGETASLAGLHSGEVVYLASETGDNLLTLRADVGLHLPAHCTALGKCLLSQLPDGEARRAAGREPYPARTERTVTRWRELHRSVEEVRRSGVAFSREEFELGLDAIAVPLAWDHGPFAAGVSLPTSRATVAVRSGIVDLLRKTARAMAA
jgi:DNA-binding IclR family transcriptional regulator